MTRAPHLLAAIGLVAALAAPAPADDPEAARLLDEVARTYRALPAYVDQGEVTTRHQVDGRSAVKTTRMALAFARPNKIVLDTGFVRLVSDGRTMATAIVPTKRFIEEPAPAAISLGALENHAVGAYLFGTLDTPPPTVLLGLLVGDDPARTLIGPGATLRAEGDRTVDGKALRVLAIDRPRAPTLRLLVDPETKQLVQMEQAIAPDALREKAPPRTSVGDFAMTWRAGAIATDAPKPATFALDRPPGFTKVVTAPGRGATEPEPPADREPRGEKSP